MARRFLWVMAILIGLVLVVAIAWRLAADQLLRLAMVPRISFAQSVADPAPDYQRREAWIARPDIPGNPARWAPPGFRPAPRPEAALFFVPPTAWLGRSRWNAPLDDRDTNDMLDLYVRTQASAFNGIAAVWAPRYRQASFGGFLAPSADMEKALALAYGDVERAFDAFLLAQPAGRPILLAGHSQGARHLLRLLVARRGALEGRLVVAYVVGWPVALPGDLAAAGLPGCDASGQPGCIASWQSFAEDADLGAALARFATVADSGGAPVGLRPMLCVNPLTGSRQPAGPERNAGMLGAERTLVPRAVGARCTIRGLLLVAPTPRDVGPFVLPGGNFHVYDYALFWANVRADAEARLSGFVERRAAPKPSGER